MGLDILILVQIMLQLRFKFGQREDIVICIIYRKNITDYRPPHSVAIGSEPNIIPTPERIAA